MMESVASASDASWPLSQCTRQVRDHSRGRVLPCSVRMHPLGPGSYAPGPTKQLDHDGASTSPGLAVVLSAALPPSGLRSGARYGLLPRIGRRHFFHHHRSDSAEALPFVVAHRRCSSFRVEPAKPPSTVRLDSGSLPEGRFPCSVVRNMEHNLATPHPSSEDNHVSRRVR